MKTLRKTEIKRKKNPRDHRRWIAIESLSTYSLHLQPIYIGHVVDNLANISIV